MDNSKPDLNRARRILGVLLQPEKGFLRVAVIYGIIISLLTLSVPIAVQTLINTVANIASVRAIFILSSILFALLLLSGVLTAMRTRVMEIYERHVYATLTSRLSLQMIMAPHSVFEGHRNFTLAQRYFDIMILQKNIPALVIDGFALVLQLVVGFTLVSFYHPMLFAFNLVVVATIYLLWLLFSRGAKQTAIKLSTAKYEAAKWLSSVTSAHEFFQSGRHLDFAGKSSESRIASYIDAHRSHFRFTFSQVLGFLLLYAVASASLLGLGGWLVIQGELSIGQLVAAELIMFAVFFGLTQFTNYLKMYYELYGAADKLGQILELPQDELEEDPLLAPADGSLICDSLEYSNQGHKVSLSFTLEAGAKAFVTSDVSWVQRDFVKLLKLQSAPDRGWLRIGNREFSEYDSYGLRHDVFFVDRSLIIECTIKQYLLMAAPNANIGMATGILDQLDISEHVQEFPDKLDTGLSAQGAPLMPTEFLLLKLTAAILAQPKIIVLNQDIDNLPNSLREKVIDTLSEQEFSVLYFTNQPVDGRFDGVLELTAHGDGNASKGVVVTSSKQSEKVTA
ncbi:MAG: ABC transporter transmembrane domain-containing protein [Gammaproteobacteria bacterium]|nr:ABC transporter transmembrane domain-containing protein [Gammaproteobacteria bacterium]MCY4358227.1 ABC transporter transmembrane domain-containing protein [Gammaproteobacteria bacterium]